MVQSELRVKLKSNKSA